MANVRTTTTAGKKPVTPKRVPKKASASASAKPANAKKTVSPTPTSRKAPAKKTAATRAQVDTKSAVTAEERQKMIAEAAYLRAESRGFAGGDPAADWLAAEAEIDQILSRT